MSKELAVELVKQGGGLLGALVWAALALTLVRMFRKQIVGLLEGRDLSFEGLGVKVAVSKAANAAALVQAAEAKTKTAPSATSPPPVTQPDPFDGVFGMPSAPPPAPSPIASPPDPPRSSPGFGSIFRPAPSPSARSPLPSSRTSGVASQALDVLLDRSRATAIGSRRILWVDDNPRNNANETRAFEELGIQVDHATDTDGALMRLQEGDYDLVISDLARGGENEAGLILMRTMKADNIDTPVVIYTSAHAAGLTQAAKAAGAVLVTSSPTTLFEAVVRRLAT